MMVARSLTEAKISPEGSGSRFSLTRERKRLRFSIARWKRRKQFQRPQSEFAFNPAGIPAASMATFPKLTRISHGETSGCTRWMARQMSRSQGKADTNYRREDATSVRVLGRRRKYLLRGRNAAAFSYNSMFSFSRARSTQRSQTAQRHDH